jgi:hypothetical protein
MYVTNVKLFLCLSKHYATYGQWMYRSAFFLPRQVSGVLHALSALPSRKEPRSPLDRKLVGPQSRSEWDCEVKILNSSPFRDSNFDPSIVQPVICQTLMIKDSKTDKQKTNSVAWVREWTIPTEWPPLVGEVSDIFCG